MGYPEGPVISIAMNVMEKNFKHHSKEKCIGNIERSIGNHQIDYEDDEVLGIDRKTTSCQSPSS